MNNNIMLSQVSPKTTIKPTYATVCSVGFDLRARLDYPLLLRGSDHVFIPVGLKVALPTNLSLLIYPRSGLACKYGITLRNGVGVVDSDYREEIQVCLWNNSTKAFTIHPNDRIAQAVLTPIVRWSEAMSNCVWVDEGDWETGTETHTGFGSTGRG